MDVITLTDSNYKEYINQDVVAFSFSGPGSMGQKCTVYIMNKAGDVFHANFAENIKHEHVKEVCPPLKTVECGCFQSRNKDKNWVPIYLGGGNFLQISSFIYNEFNRIVSQEMKIEEHNYCCLYPIWKDIVLSIINKI